MPDLTLSFNSPGLFDDVSFHPCIRHKRWEETKVLSFVPPDGSFVLMNYHVKGQLQTPIYVKPTISYSASGGRVTVIVGLKNLNRVVQDVIVTIPFSKAILTANLTANQGKIIFDDQSKECKWIIGKLGGNISPQLDGTISLPPGGRPPESNPVLSAQFSVPLFSLTGLAITNLHIHNETYKPFKGFRSHTKSGKFFVRS